jgi:hypothetical protein
MSFTFDLIDFSEEPVDVQPAHTVHSHLAAVLGAATASVLFRGNADNAITDSDLEFRASEHDSHLVHTSHARLEAILLDALRQYGDLSPDSASALDTGWLLRFIECAKTASHELEQKVWARLLSLELQSAGAFARRTLGFLRDMDPWELESFTAYCSFAFSFESGWRFMVEDDLARREMWAYGRETDMTQHWVELGLLADEIAHIELSHLRGLRLGYRDEVWELRSESAGQPAEVPVEEPRQLCYRKFTALGQQIASVLEPELRRLFARNVIQSFNSTHEVSFVPC